MADIERGSHGPGAPGQRAEYIFGTLVGELLLEIVIVNAEGQAFLREPFLDAIENVAGGIAGHVAGAQQRGEPDGVFEIRIVLNGGGVVGDAADAGAIELAPDRLEPLRGRLA